MAKKPKVYLVKYENQADQKIFFCQHDMQQKNHQIITGAELVKFENQAELKLYETKHEHRATIKITRKNFLKAA